MSGVVDDPRNFRTLSLFSGIGGIDLGLKRAGIARTVCYVEIDPYAAGVLIKNMAAGHLDVAPIWDDVRTFGESELAEVEQFAGGPIEMVCGGFPCQDISCAGKKEGIHEGNRSGLFFEIMRIVCLARPRHVFLENVPAILVRDVGIVLRELAAAGYDARWQVLSAAEVGANHLRKRFWLLADADCERGFPRQPQRTVFERRIEIIGAGSEISDTEYRRCQGRHAKRQGPATTMLPGWWATEPDVGRVAHGVSFRVDRIRCLGNAVVPQCVEALFAD